MLLFRSKHKVQWTFVNWRKFREHTGESLADIRQLAKVQGVYRRKFSGRSPMAKLQTAKFLLAKFRLPVYAQTLMFMPMSKIRYQDVRLFLCSLTLSKKWQYGESLSSGIRKLVHKPIVIVLGKSKDILIPAKMYNICNFF